MINVNKFIGLVMLIASVIMLVLSITAFSRVQNVIVVVESFTPTPTETPLIVAVITSPSTPSPTKSPSRTLTPTSTNAPTLEPDPPTPTFTPTASPSPSPIPPTPTETPILLPPTSTPVPADAIVNATDGLQLHVGPGEAYDVKATLSPGTPLEILQRVVNNDNWLKVLTTSPPGQIIDGFVAINSDAVAINVDLNEIPPIYEYGPKLLEPERFKDYPVEANITFTWNGYPLAEHQFYSIILVRDDLTDGEACFHWQATEPVITIKPEDYGCTPGAYHWGVGIATDLTAGVGDKRIWRDDSASDERNPIGLGIPHPDRPTNDNNGDSGPGPGCRPTCK
ncbi:MAG: hypothetical protein KDI79_28830 [Anaerolineae bacterium]|nr:hypothetical protein [Anaerolineae bacterium]